MEHIPIAIQTMYADLVEKAWTGATATLTGRGGSLTTQAGSDGRRYLYWQPPMIRGVRPSPQYIGIDNDVNQARVRAMQDSVAALKDRRDMVRSLRAARLPTPDKLTGDVLAAMAEAGVFRLRAAVVGSIAFQSYPGLLGVRVPASLSRTGDLDIAQFHAVTIAVESTIDEALLLLLQRIDKDFTAIPSPMDSRQTLRYALKKGSEEVFSVDVLCPLRGPDRERVTYLRALKSSAQTIRYLDYLLYQEVNAVALAGPGIPINVPAPERYALHKVLVSQMRMSNPRSQAKAGKDIEQASALIEILAELRPDDLADAWIELLERGPAWRQKAARGWRRLAQTPQAILADVTPQRFRTEIFG